MDLGPLEHRPLLQKPEPALRGQAARFLPPSHTREGLSRLSAKAPHLGKQLFALPREEGASAHRTRSLHPLGVSPFLHLGKASEQRRGEPALLLEGPHFDDGLLAPMRHALSLHGRLVGLGLKGGQGVLVALGDDG